MQEVVEWRGESPSYLYTVWANLKLIPLCLMCLLWFSLSLRSPCSAVKPLPKINPSQSLQSGNGAKRTAVSSHTNETQNNQDENIKIKRGLLWHPDDCVSFSRRMAPQFLQSSRQSLVSTFPPSEMDQLGRQPWAERYWEKIVVVYKLFICLHFRHY